MKINSLKVKKGEIFKIELGENRTTGYMWQLDYPEGIKVVSDNYMRKSELIGSGGIRTIELISEKMGKKIISGKYKRSWENKPPLNIINIIVYTVG